MMRPELKVGDGQPTCTDKEVSNRAVGTCSVLPCDASKGPTTCSGGFLQKTCYCAEGYTRTDKSTCVPCQGESEVAKTAMMRPELKVGDGQPTCTDKEVSNRAVGTCSVLPCDASKGPTTCSGGFLQKTCYCAEGYTRTDKSTCVPCQGDEEGVAGGDDYKFGTEAKCPDGYDHIEDWGECQKGAKALGITGSFPSTPMGNPMNPGAKNECPHRAPYCYSSPKAASAINMNCDGDTGPKAKCERCQVICKKGKKIGATLNAYSALHATEDFVLYVLAAIGLGTILVLVRFTYQNHEYKSIIDETSKLEA